MKAYGKTLKLIIAVLILLTAGNASAGIPLQKIVLKSTVFIKNQYGNVGTGFLMSKRLGNDNKAIFLMTNRHVLRKDVTGPYSEYIDVRFYKKDPRPGEERIRWVRLPILKRNNGFQEIVFMHPEEYVDVAGILINDVVNHLSKEVDFTNLSDDMILTRKIAQEESVDSGEDLLILGYPAGIFSETNYLPLVKPGLLSSSSSEDLSLNLGNGQAIKGKIYLIDGSLFGGNSGGPVFIKPRWKVQKREDGFGSTVRLGEGLPLYLLGIQSSSLQMKDKIYTRVYKESEKAQEYIEVEKDIMLNVVFGAEYINDIFDDYVRFREKRLSSS